MPEPVWTPSLDDTELDGLSARLREAVRGVLPELVDVERRGGPGNRPRLVRTEASPGLKLALEVKQMRRVMRADRPVLEAWFRGTVHSVDRRTGRLVEMPISGECRIDLNTGAIAHLRL